MNVRRKIVLGLGLALCLVEAAGACEMCSVYTALEVRDSKPGLYVALSEQYTDFGTLSLDGVEVDNHDDQSLESSITQLVVGYQLNRRFGLQANLPYIDRSFRRPGESGSESGIGDLALVAHWRPVERINGERLFSWGLFAGVELGTGSSDRLAEELEEDHHDEGEEEEEDDDHGHEEEESGVHGHDLALGSGSTDWLFGTTLNIGSG